jgi:hypothetical protein
MHKSALMSSSVNGIAANTNNLKLLVIKIYYEAYVTETEDRGGRAPHQAA